MRTDLFDPVTPAEQLTRLLSLLQGQGWLKAKDIEEICPALKPRTVRQLVQASEGKIISCTSKGYKLTTEATPEEFHHSCNDLRSRSKKLQSRLIQTERAWHHSPHRKT